MIFLYGVAPVGYCCLAGAMRRGWRGFLVGIATGLVTLVLCAIGAFPISDHNFSGIWLVAQSQATSLAGAAVTWWLCRFIPKPEEHESSRILGTDGEGGRVSKPKGT